MFLWDYKIIQSKCTPNKKSQTWKWIADEHLCNELKKCISLPRDFYDAGEFDSPIIPKKPIMTSEHQKWIFKSDSGQLINIQACFAVRKDSDANGAELITSKCSVKEKGQSWAFHSISNITLDENDHTSLKKQINFRNEDEKQGFQKSEKSLN